MRRLLGLSAAVLCMVLAWAASATADKTTYNAGVSTSGSVSWEWYKGLKDAINEYLPEEKTTSTAVATDFQLRLDAKSKSFTFFLANYGTFNTSNKLGYRYLTKSGEYKDVIFWTSADNFIEPYVDYDLYTYSDQTGEWTLQGSYQNDSIIGKKAGIKNGCPVLGHSSVDGWSKFLENLNSERSLSTQMGYNSFVVTGVHPAEFTVTLPDDAASNVIQLFIENNGGKAYSMSELNSANREADQHMCSAMNVNYNGTDYTFFGFEDWFGEGRTMADLNDVVLAIATGESGNVTPDIVDNRYTPKAIQTVTNTVRELHYGDDEEATALFYGTTFSSTIEEGLTGYTPVSRLVINDAEGNTVYTSDSQVGTATTGDNAWNALPNEIYLAYDLSKISGLTFHVETAYLTDAELASTSQSWDVITNGKTIYSSEDKAIENSEVTPEINITSVLATTPAATSTSLDAKVQWKAACPAFADAAKAVSEYTLTLAEDANASDNTASDKLGTPKTYETETDGTPVATSMPLKEEFGMNQTENLTYTVTGKYYTAVAATGSTGYFFNGVAKNSTDEVEGMNYGIGATCQTLTCEPGKAIFSTGANVAAYCITHNLISSAVYGSSEWVNSSIYYGSDFCMQIDEETAQKAASTDDWTAFTRLKLINKNTGEVTYPATVEYGSTTVSDSFNKISDDELTNKVASVFANYNIGDKDNYLWELEIIYMSNDEAGDNATISSNDAKSYKIFSSGTNEIVNEAIDLAASITVPRYHYVKGNTNMNLSTDVTLKIGSPDLLTAYSFTQDGLVANSSSLKITNQSVIGGWLINKNNLDDNGEYSLTAKEFTYGTQTVIKQGQCDTVYFSLPYSYYTTGPKSVAFASYASVTGSNKGTDWTTKHVSAVATDYSLWLAPNAVGMKSRVTNNFFNSYNDERDQSTGSLIYRKYAFNELSTNSEIDVYEKDNNSKQLFHEGVEPSQDTDISGGDDTETEKETSMDYPTGEKNSFWTYGLDLKATLMSDVNSYLGYNAVVLVHDQDGVYVKNDEGNVKYYVVNSYNSPFAATSEITANATGVAQWWRQDGNVISPAIATGLDFNQVELEDANYSVDIYLVYGNSLRSISELTGSTSDNRQYQLKFTHLFTPNGQMTGIDDINSDANAAKTVKSVIYYNMAGMASAEPTTGVSVKVITYTDGTTKAVKVLSK